MHDLVVVVMDTSESKPRDPCIQQEKVFNANNRSCPREVQDQVSDLWRDKELLNNACYYPWHGPEDAEKYPLIEKYLVSQGVTRCLILWSV